MERASSSCIARITTSPDTGAVWASTGRHTCATRRILPSICRLLLVVRGRGQNRRQLLRLRFLLHLDFAEQQSWTARRYGHGTRFRAAYAVECGVLIVGSQDFVKRSQRSADQ